MNSADVNTPYYIDFKGLYIRNIVCNGKHMYFAGDLWRKIGGYHEDRFEEFLRTREAEKLLRQLCPSDSASLSHKRIHTYNRPDVYNLDIDGVIGVFIDWKFKDDWTEEFIVCKELAEAYLEWISPSIELNPPLYDIDDDYEITDDNDLGCGY